MKQLALDIGLASTPTLNNFFAGPNADTLNHLRLWTASGSRAPVPTYLWGESGSGKEVVARHVHQKSRRSSKPFISVNCAAIPENLLESELFGHEKGAFTGALARRIGKFEEANGGTLLLDEISEMDARLQAKLLRAIQEREIDRVGGSQPVKVDIRILATSNRDLVQAVREAEVGETRRSEVAAQAERHRHPRRLEAEAASEPVGHRWMDSGGLPKG
jgi:transcriptional regulator with PAS, ATPase and Fis domain